MPEPLHRLLVITRYLTHATDMPLRELAALSHALDLELLLPPDEAERHPDVLQLGFAVLPDDRLEQADACLVFGGDGTMLRALSRLLGTGVPAVGANFGNVGFLADLPHERWQAGLAQVVGGDYTVVDLLTVQARQDGSGACAINDVVLIRRTTRGVLHLEYSVSGTTIGVMRCDGMVIASPAGSTAYNLSCGGPIVVWDADALVLNFVAPHSLGFRPLVVGGHDVVSVRNVSGDAADVLIDGRVQGSLSSGEELCVEASPLRARLLVREPAVFFRNVEEKLFGNIPDSC
jgi:NAD+ kinase